MCRKQYKNRHRKEEKGRSIILKAVKSESNKERKQEDRLKRASVLSEGKRSGSWAPSRICSEDHSTFEFVPF